jgi:nicotinamidase-related amidase
LTALLLIDFQNEWEIQISPYYLGNLAKLIKNTNKLIDFCRNRKLRIIFTQHIELNSSTEFAQETKRSELFSTLHRQSSDCIVVKNKINPFFQTDLSEKLSGVKSLVIAGILTNLCVRSAIEDAYDRGFGITVVKDCCATFNKRFQNFTFEDLKSTRDDIKFLLLEEFIKSLKM